MHEMSIAQNIVELVTEKARAEDAAKVTRIDLAVGSLSGVMIDALKFGFEVVTKGTIAEGTELQIDEIPARAICRDCDLPFDADSYITRCPKCNGYVVDMLQGQELKLTSIIIE